MREDMHRMIAQRGRMRWNRSRKMMRKGRWRVEPLEDRPKAERMRNLGEFSPESRAHAAPLKRFLMRRVGLRWDDVFSEICEHARLESDKQRRLRGLVPGIVALNAEIIDGEVYDSCRQWLRCWLYVDPESGVLRLAPRRPRRRRLARTGIVRLDASRELRRIAGLWYEVGFAPVPDNRVNRFVWDLLERRDMTAHELWKAYGSVRYTVSKRQLNSRELRRYRAAHPAAFA